MGRKTMTKWNNFNDAEDQMSYELIPHKTIAKVVMLIKKEVTLHRNFQMAMLLKAILRVMYILLVSL